MTKLHLPKFRISTKALLISLAVLLVVVVFAYGAVREQQYSIVTKQQKAAEVAAQQAKVDNLNKQIASLQAQNKTLAADKAASCTYLTSLTLAKATKSLVIVPTATNCPLPKQ